MHKKSILINFIFAICLFFVFPIKAYAAEVSVFFGSESYEVQKGMEFNVGVYIEAEESIGKYNIEIEYDITRLEYISGADAANDGILAFRGIGNSKNIKYWLTFRATDSGEAGLNVNKAIVNGKLTGDEDELTVSKFVFAPITISGGDNDKASFRQFIDERAAEAAKIENRYPVLGTVSVNDTQMYLLDHKQYIPETADWKYSLTEGSFGGTLVTFLTDAESRIQVMYLMDEAEECHAVVISKLGEVFELSDSHDSLGRPYRYVTALACSNYPEYVDAVIAEKEDIAYVLDNNGHGTFAQLASNGDLIEWTEASFKNQDEAQQPPEDNTEDDSIDAKVLDRGPSVTVIAILITVFVLSISVVSGIAVFSKKQRLIEKVAKSEEEPAKTLDTLDIIEVGDDTCVLVYDENEAESEKDIRIEEHQEAKEEPVISIQNVTMKYRISTSDASGLKEFIIQKIKKRVSYRELLALNNVSFDVYKGEVVGIIGTNGSGKSTLLRIVSGALNPTSGRVIVDKSKVQILTLGTGFDMELTARENVYLNGAIIGYSKKFLDTHFDEIIAFAELEDFVDEKVKNFSSGMVSRLGFAIATAGNAAEILILDEVLSVGDEFFKKKSLARIKEMIHGGSTVLMVSHGLSTITENCSKAVWIEKGKLQMVGDVDSVCRAYQNMQMN